MELDRNNDDGEHREVFGFGGMHINVSNQYRELISQIKNNDPELETFILESHAAEHFSDLAWELLGRFIAKNDYLDQIDLSDLHFTDEKMSLLFKKMTRARSLKTLDLSYNEFGLNGIQSMVSLLKNARNLTKLAVGYNDNINAECFRLLVNALHGGSIKDLRFGKCNIDDITVLGNCTLPHLLFLDLDRNNIEIIPSFEQYINLEQLRLGNNSIGKEGCRSISKLLQNESSSLRVLDLTSNNIGDEEVEILADSLKHNTTLAHLSLANNNIKEEGCRAFLKLLNDASSIVTTFNSNHTLKALRLPYSASAKIEEMKIHIFSALKINKEHSGNSAGNASNAKVIQTQLNSNTRRELCHVQCIDYSYSSLFAEIEPDFLPDILALVGEKHGQNEVFRMLIATVPDLASVINKKAVIKNKIAENTARMTTLDAEYARQIACHAALTAKHFHHTAALTSENLQLKKELVSIDSEGKNPAVAVRGKTNWCGRKIMRRSASF